MADHARVETADEIGENLAERQRTYRFFVSLVKWCLGVIAVILLTMAYFLT